MGHRRKREGNEGREREAQCEWEVGTSAGEVRSSGVAARPQPGAGPSSMVPFGDRRRGVSRNTS